MTIEVNEIAGVCSEDGTGSTIEPGIIREAL
jgi:hypothetical protein